MPIHYADDAPLHDPDEDQFGLASFARRLSRILRTAQEGQNVVVGLNGAWGVRQDHGDQLRACLPYGFGSRRT
jgi:predicted KAP-like P-loop ATPase